MQYESNTRNKLALNNDREKLKWSSKLLSLQSIFFAVVVVKLLDNISNRIYWLLVLNE